MTTMPKAQEISRKWYIIDAANRPLGRTAAAAAAILRAHNLRLGNIFTLHTKIAYKITGRFYIRLIAAARCSYICTFNERRYVFLCYPFVLN